MLLSKMSLVGRSGGLVIDVGKESTSLSPVQEGYIVQVKHFSFQ
jgi:actin-related protein